MVYIGGGSGEVPGGEQRGGQAQRHRPRATARQERHRGGARPGLRRLRRPHGGLAPEAGAARPRAGSPGRRAEAPADRLPHLAPARDRRALRPRRVAGVESAGRSASRSAAPALAGMAGPGAVEHVCSDWARRRAPPVALAAPRCDADVHGDRHVGRATLSVFRPNSPRIPATVASLRARGWESLRASGRTVAGSAYGSPRLGVDAPPTPGDPTCWGSR